MTEFSTSTHTDSALNKQLSGVRFSSPDALVWERSHVIRGFLLGPYASYVIGDVIVFMLSFLDRPHGHCLGAKE